MKTKKRYIRLKILMISACFFSSFLLYAQTNPTAQNLSYSQNFGTNTFTVMPTGMAAWTVSSSPKGSQSSAESSIANGNATITAATTTQLTGGCYGYENSNNGRLYIQTSSNNTNGTNQFTTAIITTNLQNIKVCYDIEMISAQAKTIGVVLQYRVGTSGTWTTVSNSIYAHNSSDRSAGQIDNFTNLSLPAAANDNAEVQLRWATWRGSETGNSSGIGIDNISITASAIPTSYYFRSKQNGNWNSSSSWEMSNDNNNWVNATFGPNYKCKTITIQDAHQITLTACDTVDQLVVNGTLTYGDYSGNVLSINNEAGVDLTINGTFEDFGPSSINWLGSSTWEMGSSGTLVRSRSTSANNWRDKYNNGISNIPATANWIIRKTSGDSPSLSTTGGMYYPNLIIENNTTSQWIMGGSSIFTGYTDYPRIKGNFDIGGSGSNTVSFLNENTNGNPVLVDGNITVQSGSTLRNYGTGIEFKGNLTINGTLNYDSDDSRKLIFSGANAQIISGSGTLNIYDLSINKSANNVTLGRTITIDNLLNLTAKNIILGSNDLIFGSAANISGASVLSFVVTNSTGKILKKYAATGSTFTFPTGDGSNYTPYSLTLNSATFGSNPFISVRVVNSIEPHISGISDYINRYWDVNQNDIANFNADVNYVYVDGDIVGDENNFVSTLWSNSLKYIGEVSKTGNTATGNNINVIGNFSLAGICNQTVNAGPDVIILAGDSLQIGCSPIYGSTYLWKPGTGLSDSTVANPWAKPYDTHEYLLMVTNSAGCLKKDKAIVQIRKNLVHDMAPKDYRSDGLYSTAILIKTIDSTAIPVTSGGQLLLGTNSINSQCQSLKNIFEYHALKNEANPDSVIFKRSNLDYYIPDSTTRNIFCVVFPVMVNIDSIVVDLTNNQYIEKINPPFTFQYMQDGIPYGEESINGKQWHIEELQASNAWVFLQNIPQSEKKIVGIIDEGIADHGIEFHNPQRIVNTNPAQCSSSNLHSTEVGSIIASNPGLTTPHYGSISVGYNIPLLSTHDLECAKEINWDKPYVEFFGSQTQNGSHPKFLNLSFVDLYEGTSLYSNYFPFQHNSITWDFIKSMTQHDRVLVFAASGNSQNINGSPTRPGIGYPFGIPGVIGVGATKLSPFPPSSSLLGEFGRGSNIADDYNYNVINNIGGIDNAYQKFGYIDLVAPGKDITVATHTSTIADTYTQENGTSLSSPMVAAIAASMSTVNPELSLTEIKNILFQTADKVHYLPDGIGSDYNLPASLNNSDLNMGYSYQNGGIGYEGFYDTKLDHIMGYGRINMLSCIMNAAGKISGGFHITSDLDVHKVTIHNENDQYSSCYYKGTIPPYIQSGSPYFNQKYEYDCFLNQTGTKIYFEDDDVSLELASNSTFRISNFAEINIKDNADLIFQEGTEINNTGQQFTKIVAEDNGKINLSDNNFVVPEYSIMELRVNGVLNLDNARLTIEPGGILLVRGGNINLTNSSKISVMCGGYIVVEAGSSVNIATGSNIDIYQGAYTCLNDLNSCSTPYSAAGYNYFVTYVGTTNSLLPQNYPFAQVGVHFVNTNVTIDGTFSYSATQGQCMGESVTFSPATNLPVNYEWDFGDGETISGDANDIIPTGTNTIGTYLNPVHVYAEPGNYVVVLSINQPDPLCGATCSTQIINIIPSTATYNPNCCSETQVTYTTSIPFIQYDTNTGNFNVLPNTVVNISNINYKIKGSIIVKPNSVLNITSGSVLEFGPNGKIIVEPKGKLVLSSCNLKGLDLCGTMWQGVEVWGKSNSAIAGDQGEISISTNTEISDAHTAVLLGKSKLCFSNICSGLCKKLQYDLYYSGGIIKAQGTYFTNDAIGVKFLPYKFINSSSINNSTYYCTVLSDPGYNTNNTYTYGSSNTHNPFYAPANELQRTAYGVYLWNVRWKMYSTTTGFDGNNYDNLQIGLESFDSRFSVTNINGVANCGVFSNLNYGIRIFNTASSINNGHYILKNKFRYVDKACIYIDGAKYWDRIELNMFGHEKPPFEPQANKTGIYLKNSYAFRIYDNTFTHLKNGIFCVNNYQGSGNIMNKNGGNNFNGCYRSIYTFRNNNYLKIKCNNFNFDNMNFPASEYQYSLLNQGKLGNQGSLIDNNYPVSEYSKFPAGNLFDDGNPPNPKKLLHNPIASPYYSYYYHFYSSNYNEALKPELAFIYDHINLVPIDVEYNKTSCDPFVYPADIAYAILKINNSIDSLNVINAVILDNLDNGNTTELILAINSNSTSEQLKNDLLGNLPLSDQVLIATITSNRNFQLSPENFMEIFLPNSPVSDTLRYYLDEKVKSLPSSIAQQIIKVQGINPGINTTESINRSIAQKEADKQILFSEFIPRLANNDSLETALDLLSMEKTITAKQAVIATYLIEGNYSNAQIALNVLQANTDIPGWINLSAMYLKLQTDSNTVFEIDSIQQQIIRLYAANEAEPLLSSNAQAILRLVYGEEFPLEIPEIQSGLKLTNNILSTITTDNQEYLGNNTPNPFSNTTKIPYFMPDIYSKGQIIIYDVRGGKLMEFDLKKGKNTLNVSLCNMSSGVYWYSILFDGFAFQYKKMVNIKN